MAYELRYTDELNKGTIIVEDQTLNIETSLAIPGRFRVDYGIAIGESLLHLLENFANSEPPAKPVEGQLWYDTTPTVDQLKIYDGTNWVAAGGLKKGALEPSIAQSIAGDLWANTDTQQLYLFTGSGWILVGPQFSDGLLTGTESESVVGIDDIEYPILAIKIQDKYAAIISSQEFTPKSVIPGFAGGIKPGFNISSTPLVGTETLKYYGTAEKAESLIVNGEAIAASNFLRGNTTSTTNFGINIKNNQGIKIGSGGQLTVGIDGNAGIISNSSEGSYIDLKTTAGGFSSTVIRVDSTRRVGINNPAPDVELDIAGDVQISPLATDATTGLLILDSTTDSSDISTGSFVTKGGVGIAKTLNVGGDLGVEGTIYSTNVVPDISGSRDIGEANNKYNRVFATTFFGNLQGNVSGTVSGRAGSADRLSTATTFQIAGDVETDSFAFDGQTGGTIKQFEVRISNSFIANRTTSYDASNSDTILINKPEGAFKISKRNFLKTIPLNPPGIILPFGGTVEPAGWLFCFGQVVTKSDYPQLWEVIGHNFLDPGFLDDAGVNTFALPDMRGRLPLGLDNMGGAAANRVTGPGATDVGNNSGSEDVLIGLENLPEHEHDMEGESAQYYAVNQIAGSLEADAIPLNLEPGGGGYAGYPSSGGIKTTADLGQALNVMNPYLALNYIIYTGQ